MSTPVRQPGMLIINRNEWRKTTAEKELLKEMKSAYKATRGKEKSNNQRNEFIKMMLDSPVPNWGGISLRV